MLRKVHSSITCEVYRCLRCSYFFYGYKFQSYNHVKNDYSKENTSCSTKMISQLLRTFNCFIITKALLKHLKSLVPGKYSLVTERTLHYWSDNCKRLTGKRKNIFITDLFIASYFMHKKNSITIQYQLFLI